MNAPTRIPFSTTAANDTQPAPDSDDALLVAVSRGDGAALAALYARHAPALRRVASAVLYEEGASRDGVDDVVQEVFLALAAGRAAAFRPARGQVRAWLSGIARRAARAHAAGPSLASLEQEALREMAASDRVAEEESGVPALRDEDLAPVR